MPFKTAICPECAGTGVVSVSETHSDAEWKPVVIGARTCPYCTRGQIQVYVPEQPEPRQPDIMWREMFDASLCYAIVAALFVAVIYGERISAWWHGVIQ